MNGPAATPRNPASATGLAGRTLTGRRPDHQLVDPDLIGVARARKVAWMTWAASANRRRSEALRLAGSSDFLAFAYL